MAKPAKQNRSWLPCQKMKPAMQLSFIACGFFLKVSCLFLCVLLSLYFASKIQALSPGRANTEKATAVTTATAAAAEKITDGECQFAWMLEIFYSAGGDFKIRLEEKLCSSSSSTIVTQSNNRIVRQMTWKSASNHDVRDDTFFYFFVLILVLVFAIRCCSFFRCSLNALAQRMKCEITDNCW